MADPRPSPASRLKRAALLLHHDMLVLLVLATATGACAALGIIALREAIGLCQLAAFGTASVRLVDAVSALPAWQVILAPMAGGLAVGILARTVMPEGRPHGVADAIEASALKAGRMSARAGLGAAAISTVSIGCGASVGREGPAVHIGASLGSWIGDRLRLGRVLKRTLLGCGVAAAVAASFNAPIAGALFAGEVVIGHYALTAFAPVVVASVIGTMVSRAYFGDTPAFAVVEHAVLSLWELPAYAAAGIIAGGLGWALVRGIALAHRYAGASPVPPWARPALAGLAVGLLALVVPQVLGVGYGVTEDALSLQLGLWTLLLICAAKIVATALCLGWGFGGGIFSPALVIGATFGAAYGLIISALFPALAGGGDAFPIIGMGAVAAPVLGAPISTTLIIFEMTQDHKLTLAVMLAVVTAGITFRLLHGQSFFAWQLRNRGLDLHGGFQAALLRSIRVGDIVSRRCELVSPDVHLHDLRLMLQQSSVGELFVIGERERLVGTITLADLSEAAFDAALDDLVNAEDVARRSPPMLALDDTLETALAVIRSTGEAHIPVVVDRDSRTFAGCVHEREAMLAYNRALIEARLEERQ